jgi:predicted Zn-dependent protease with MMP-like domain
MQRGRFLKLVRKALADVPDPFATWLDNVDILIENRPTKRQRQEIGLQPGDTLFGLYEGIPQTERDSGYGMVLPDTITIFQEPLQQACRDDAELIEEVRVTVLHELAHYFGMSDDELHRLGLD